jgi:hypothetical protein
MVRQRPPELVAQLRDLFTEDATVDMTCAPQFGVYHGIDEIMKLYTELMTPSYHWMWHSFQTPIIEVEGDHARASWTIIAMTLPKSAALSAPPSAFYGRYRDDYRRTSSGWKHSFLRGINDRPRA